MNTIQQHGRYPFINACKGMRMLRNGFVVGLVGVKAIQNKGEMRLPASLHIR